MTVQQNVRHSFGEPTQTFGHLQLAALSLQFMHIKMRSMPNHPSTQTKKNGFTYPVLETLAVYSCVNQWSSLIIIICNIKPFFCTVYCSKNVCWRSREFGCRTVRTFRPQSDGAEVSWVRSVVGPKCLDTFVFLCGEIITSHHMEKTDAGLVASESFNYFKQFYHVSMIASIFKCR